jgi:pimeloyl-ACP methyl ester carboxylesterase
VTWRGYQSQFEAITPNYHANVTNAFGHAARLADFLNGLGGETVVAAHSLGNMVVSSAIQDGNASFSKYLMINAAVALEAYDENAPPRPEMVHQDWFQANRPAAANYPERLWATEWHQLYSPQQGFANDGRFTLTWRGRFRDLALREVYNFYSSGEEVLATHPEETPTVFAVLEESLREYWRGALPGQFAWALQEKLKGRTETGTVLGSAYGGWGFQFPGLPPAEAAQWTDATLRVLPFFKVSGGQSAWPDQRFALELFGDNGNGSRLVTPENRAKWLAQAFPARTLPAGANRITRFNDIHGDERNFNINDAIFKNGWPPSRINDEFRSNRWLHSDIREVAYAFTHLAFQRFVELGALR